MLTSGSGVLFSEVDADKVSVRARLDYGRLHLDAGTSTELETLAIGIFDDARKALFIKGSHFVEIEQAGHISNIEQPDVFNQAVIRFLADVDRNVRPHANA